MEELEEDTLGETPDSVAVETVKIAFVAGEEGRLRLRKGYGLEIRGNKRSEIGELGNLLRGISREYRSLQEISRGIDSW